MGVSEKQERADQLEERLIDFAVRIINLSSRLPKTRRWKTYRGTDSPVLELLRSKLQRSKIG